MSKRPLDTSNSEPRKPKRLALEDGEAQETDLLGILLVEEIFGLRPTRLEEVGVQYLADMRHDPRPSADTFLAFVQTACPAAKGAHCGKVWNKLKDFFGEAESRGDIEGLTNISAFVEAFQEQQYLEAEEALQPETEPERATTPSPTPGTTSPPSTVSRVSRRSPGTRLSARGATKMKEEYRQHFAAFQGEKWLLPSGACVDTVVGQYVQTLTKESALHSFVVDSPTTILDLFADPQDKARLIEVLVQRAGERVTLVSPAEKAYFQEYDKEPAEVLRLLSRGWRADEGGDPDEGFREAFCLALHQIYVVYRCHEFRLPEDAAESFYLQTLWGFIGTLVQCDPSLKFRPAEVHSQASALCKNADRTIEGTAKQAVGRKVDGLITSVATSFELCVLEVARKDLGPNGTKALSDTRKLAKVLKDSFDAISSKATTDISNDLAVFGLRIAGATLTFYSMRKRQGRLYQLANDGTITFPSQWNGTTTTTILTIVAALISLRRRVAAMDQQVAEWTRLSLEDLDTSVGFNMPQTLTTPPGSPRA